MIARILHIARREWLENVRQPTMIVTMAGLFAIIAGGVLMLMWRLEALHASPDGDKALAYWAGLLGLSLTSPSEELAAFVIVTLDFLVFSQLLGMTAVIAGHVGIHDRLCGTRPFLLLAPVRRTELLAGKILGALAMPLAVYLVLGGLASAIAASFSVAAASPSFLPPAPGWWVGFLIGAPMWSLWVAVLCVTASMRAPDVRTAQQIAWFIVFFATMALGPLLVQAMPLGAVAQLVLAGVAAALTLVSLGAGTIVMGRGVR